MKKMLEIDNFSYKISIEQIKREIDYDFHLVCSKDALRELPKRLNVIEAKNASFNGNLKLQLANQIFLFGTVRAKLIQPCSLTLEPVVTTIYRQISRTFLIGPNEKKPIKKSVFELTEKSASKSNKSCKIFHCRVIARLSKRYSSLLVSYCLGYLIICKKT